MNLLLDTCAALWLWSGDRRLSRTMEDALRAPGNTVVFHQVSYLEITLKHALNRLPMREPPSVLVPRALKAYGVEYASLSNRDIAGLEKLPWHHRDPFDRLLIAHALAGDYTVVTADRRFRDYGVAILE